MAGTSTASVIINNYNYGRFLSDAIESALAQTYPRTEVVVVDDGSEDNSRTIISRYAGRVIPVLKKNGGQGSAFNEGFAASKGETVIFLDADDMLLPHAVEHAVDALRDAEVVKVHWQLRVIDQAGRDTGQLRPGGTLPSGDLREAAFRLGPTNHLSPPTSGNAWARRFLERVLPVPENVYRTCADTYLFELAPFFGLIKTIPSPQSAYRRHGQNLFSTKPLEAKLKHGLLFYENYANVLVEYCQARGHIVDLSVWRRRSWWHRLDLAIHAIEELPHEHRTMILIDDATWDEGPVAGRARLPFLERDGKYWGNPPNDETAVRELERMRSSGAALLVIAWPAFWWMQYYTAFVRYLRCNFSCLIDNEQIIAFDLTASADGSPVNGFGAAQAGQREAKRKTASRSVARRGCSVRSNQSANGAGERNR